MVAEGLGASAWITRSGVVMHDRPGVAGIRRRRCCHGLTRSGTTSRDARGRVRELRVLALALLLLILWRGWSPVTSAGGASQRPSPWSLRVSRSRRGRTRSFSSTSRRRRLSTSSKSSWPSCCSSTRPRWKGLLRREPRATARLLLIAPPLSLVLAVAFGALTFPHANFWIVACIATVVMPTDLTPVVALVRDRRVPARLRDIINVGERFNDGFIAPLFLFALAAAHASINDSTPDLDALIEAARRSSSPSRPAPSSGSGAVG